MNKTIYNINDVVLDDGEVAQGITDELVFIIVFPNVYRYLKKNRHHDSNWRISFAYFRGPSSPDSKAKHIMGITQRNRYESGDGMEKFSFLSETTSSELQADIQRIKQKQLALKR